MIEYDHLIRRVWLDRPLPRVITPTYAGYSVGRWAGNTLVVETSGLKDATIARNPAMARVTRVLERIRKIDGGREYEDVATVEGVDRAGRRMSETQTVKEVWRSEGGMDDWEIEGPSVMTLVRGGWTMTTLHPGDHVKVIPARRGDGGDAGSFMRVTLPDGTIMGTGRL